MHEIFQFVIDSISYGTQKVQTYVIELETFRIFATIRDLSVIKESRNQFAVSSRIRNDETCQRTQIQRKTEGDPYEMSRKKKPSRINIFSKINPSVQCSSNLSQVTDGNWVLLLRHALCLDKVSPRSVRQTSLLNIWTST